MNEETLFHLALEKPPNERVAFLDEACAGDAALRQRLEILLAAHEHPGSFLQPAAQDNGNGEPASNSGRTVIQSGVQEGPGTVIGPYKLLQQIGEGGMGVVFMAEQTQPVRRTVALKIIKPGMDSRQVIARFEAERQALALMDHPNIARVFDAGTTDSGRPYFVMELVKGVAITKYCDEHRLTPQDRLELFVHVCHAVQHAHQKGIIHRDLKPSNVLIAQYDGKPVPKVIDFGVAKATGQQLTERSMFTGFGEVIGTPEYMSPEQAELNQLDIDTRSDVYSLGVLLYELLTGTTPIEHKRVKEAALLEVLRVIREEEPPKPSTRLSTVAELPSIAAQRGLEPKKLSGLVKGELDWIVMKCLEKDRNRRYETASSLALDLQRHLTDEPVEARPASQMYRLQKFIRRNKMGVVAGSAIAAALVLGTIVSTWQAIRATRAERVAQDERLEAEKQHAAAEANFQKAKAAVDKYFTLVSESTLFNVPGLQPLRKDLLEAALEFYEGAALERASDPAVLVDVALMHLKVGLIYESLNRYNDYIAANRRALEVIEQLRRDYPDADDHERKLAGFWKGQRWTRLNMESPHDLPGAIKTCLRLEAIWKQLADRYPSEPGFQMDLAYLQAVIGGGLIDVGRTNEGLAYFDNGYAVVEKLIGEYPDVPQYRADLAVGSQSYANNLLRAGRPDEALPIAHRSVELGEGLVAEFPAVPAYRQKLAEGLSTLGNLFARTQSQQAEASYRRANDLAELLVREFPDEPLYMETLGRNVAFWASFETARGNHAQAEDIVLRTAKKIESQLQVRPRDRPLRELLGRFCYQVAEQLARQGNFGELFERMERRALVLVTELADEFPTEPSYRERVGHAHRWLGGAVAQRAGRLDEARQHFEKAVDAFTRLAEDKTIPQGDGSNRAFQADSLIRLSLVLAAAGQVQKSAAAARHSVDIYESLVSDFPKNLENRGNLTEAVRVLGVAQYRAGEWQSAVETLGKSLKLRDGGDAFDWFFLAMARWQLGEKDEARKWHDKAVAWLNTNRSNDSYIENREELSRLEAEAQEVIGKQSGR